MTRLRAVVKEKMLPVTGLPKSMFVVILHLEHRGLQQVGL